MSNDTAADVAAPSTSFLEENGISLTRSPDLVLLLNTAKGGGVFAARDIPARTTLEVCPVKVFSPQENDEYIRHTSLYFYTYNWRIETVTSTRSSLDNDDEDDDGDDDDGDDDDGDYEETHDSEDATNEVKPESKAQDMSSKTRTRTTTIATQALPLGLGAMFNHSRRAQNVGWARNLASRTITYVSLRDIARGEELCISYGEPDRLGFVDADDAAAASSSSPEAPPADAGMPAAVNADINA